MKRYLLFFVIIFFTLFSAMGQGSNTQSENEDSVECVDLGLSVRWATCNVGASKPEEVGSKFAWGETEEKELYDERGYKHYDAEADSLIKYGADGKRELDAEDDAATVNMGEDWRMPTQKDMQELMEKCQWVWTIRNGVAGCDILGPNGNSIFMPATVKVPLCEPCSAPPKRIGVFSVAKDRQVSFSQGNLQCFAKIRMWKFADYQYDFWGESNVQDGGLCQFIDLFGWSADNKTAPFGISISTNAADYAGEFVDWGNNWICGDAPGTWRTLSADEWEYLLNGRVNAGKLRGRAQIDGVNGFVFLPDDWECPEGIEFKADVKSVFTIEEWAILEEVGAVFLPATGRRNGVSMINIDDHGNYWSSTRRNSNYAEYLAFTFSSNKLYVDAQLPITLGRSVRLVHDTIVPKPAKRIGVFSVAADKHVSFSQGNLQYVQSSDTWQFAEEQTEYIGKRNLIDENVLADTIDLFGWSGEDSKIPFGVNVSCNRTDYAGDFVDWGVNIIHSNLPNIWRTLSYEEWDYIVNQRQNAQNLYGMAAVNGVDGLILLPDDWVCPENITFISGYSLAEKMTDYSSHQMFTLEQWHELENLGAVFIPAAGGRNESGTHGYSYSGGYWCSSWDDEAKANVFHFYSSLIKKANQYRYWGYSVRLVHDTIVPKVEPEYVDLGLRVKWATFNVGASAPEDYGDYFAWGEVEPKEKYGWETYKWCDGTASNMTKYNKTDGLTTLELDDDAAHVNWGGKWRIPSKVELQELFEKCVWEADTVNGISGHRVTGPNGNSIFIPTAGYYNHDHGEGIQGLKSIMCLWTSSCNGNSNAYDLMFYHSTLPDGVSSNTRRVGFPIRPVFDESVVTFTINCTPEDARVGFYYSGGFHAHGNSVLVKKGASPLYQVEATKEGYLSQGDTLHNITKDTMLNITLMPFSEGMWVEVDNSEFTQVDSYFVSKRTGGFVGPHSNWSYFYAPAIPGEIYRVCARAGQLAAIWYAASNAPNQEDSIRPNKVDCSKNGGITRYIAEEFTIPEGATCLIINDASHGKDLVIERKVPDPCLVVKVNDTLAINMMSVEKGTFMMGASDDDEKAKSDEKPQHQVTITYDYKMMQTEVTQGMWEAVMGEDIYDLRAKSRSPEQEIKFVGADYPVFYVQFYQCLEFIEWLNELTGLHFRFPTEAEWEYAARGGQYSKGYLYSGSNDAKEVATINYAFKTVASLRPNELGICDMSGNIAEMTLDFAYGVSVSYPSADPQINPRQVTPIKGYGINRMCRNSHPLVADSVRITQRYPYTPTWCGNWVGFRLVLAEDYDFKTILVNNVAFDMGFVKGGTFTMGNDNSNNASPAHQVTLSDYYIGQTEVTQALWKAVMGTNPSKYSDEPYKPVECVSWEDARLFVEKLSEKTGLRFRLPTEAEWEYAARGGVNSRGYAYAGSNDIDSVAWYSDNSDQMTHIVGQKMPNELGLYDMSGNVWEWCQDWHEPYTAEAQVNPQGADEGEKRVIRGGCWHYNPIQCTPTYRYSYYTPEGKGASVGLRLVLEVDY